jgi:hypothetical protein
VAERKSPRRVSVVDLAGETKLGSQVLAFDDREVVQLLRAAIEREGNQTAYARRHGVVRRVRAARADALGLGAVVVVEATQGVKSWLPSMLAPKR